MTPEDLIAHYALQPIPREGGRFRQTWAGPERDDGRPAGTAIVALLTAEPGDYSALHRLPGDEIWHYHLGDPLRMLLLAPDGSCYAGDAAGVRVAPLPFVAPVSPPPDIDVAAWHRSLDEIEARRPGRLCLPHFGVVESPEEHLEAMRERLDTWSERVRRGADEEEFVQAAHAELAEALSPQEAAAYTQAGPLWQSYAGLRRYWDKAAA